MSTYQPRKPEGTPAGGQWAATTTRSGLRVQAELDTGDYPIGRRVTDAELAAVNLRRHDWHPEWNYSISPP